MNSDQKNKPDGVLQELPAETMDWLRQVNRQLQANFAGLDAMPMRYTRETGMDEPDLDISPEPYEAKKPG